MSADNGLIVATIQGEMEHYGIWHYFASDEEEPDRTEDSARETFDNPLRAIVAAHVLQRDEMTEYGVYVTPQVLYDAKRRLG